MDDDAFMKYDGTTEGGFVGHGALKEVYLGMILHNLSRIIFGHIYFKQKCITKLGIQCQKLTESFFPLFKLLIFWDISV